VIDAIKEFLQIDVNHNLPPGLHVALRGQDRVVRPSARTKAVAVFAEGGVK
jgi:hypothetical protein